ncbi:hypothetical protein GCM10009682_57900 [Luedemannella flava]|uniref:Uncharacterized protein n=1 Tax=Luedemannella flava TaxID=349316 RepID=A0ABN2MLS7_9ACTN
MPDATLAPERALPPADPVAGYQIVVASFRPSRTTVSWRTPTANDRAGAGDGAAFVRGAADGSAGRVVVPAVGAAVGGPAASGPAAGGAPGEQPTIRASAATDAARRARVRRGAGIPPSMAAHPRSDHP